MVVNEYCEPTVSARCSDEARVLGRMGSAYFRGTRSVISLMIEAWKRLRISVCLCHGHPSSWSACTN